MWNGVEMSILPTILELSMLAKNASVSNLLLGHWNEPYAICRRANLMKFPGPLQLLQSPTVRRTSKEIDVLLGNCGMESG